MARTTKQDFFFYQDECDYWAMFFGINSYVFRFSHEEDDDALARVQWAREHGLAIFYLATHWGSKDPVSDKAISCCAFHEVCELMLAGLNDLACIDQKVNKVNTEVHRIIRILENTVFENEWNRRNIPEGI